MQDAFWSIVCVGGLVFWAYWVGSLSLARSEQVQYTGRHFGLFAAACLDILFSCFLMAMACVLVIVLIPAGCLGWLLLANAWRLQRKERATFRRAHPLPKLQYRFGDLCVAVGIFVSFMAGYSVCIAGEPKSEEYITLTAIVFLPVCLLGFLCAADIHRRMPAEHANRRRIWRILFVLAWFIATFGFGGILAWSMWSRALFLMDIHAWRRAKQKAQLKKEIAAALAEAATSSQPATPDAPQSSP